MSLRLQVGALLVGTALAFSTAMQAMGQTDALERSVIAASGSLNDAQKAALGAFVNAQADRIRTSSNAADVEAAARDVGQHFIANLVGFVTLRRGGVPDHVFL
jgi:hypothetical protein